MTWFPTALFFASRGFVTVSFQTRIKSVHASTPVESMEDARSAFRWIQSNAKSLGIDPDKIVAAGDSSGAHLAFSIPLLSPEPDKPTVPRAIVALYPVVDATLKGFDGISPIDFLNANNLPPTLILQGSKDSEPGTPPKRTKDFCDKADRLAGKPVCRAIFFDGPPDYFHGFIGANPQYLTMIGEMERFLIDQRLDDAPKPFDPKSDSLTPECQASADSAIFKHWVEDSGYSTATSSLW